MNSNPMESVVTRKRRAAEELDQRRRSEFEEVIAAIRLHGKELLSLPGVLFVRPGYRFRDGKLTTEPAVVVSVASKQDITSLAVRDLVPRKLGSVVVDVVPANPKEQLRFHSLPNALLDTESRISLVPNLFIPAAAPADLLEPPRFFEELKLTRNLTVQPLMTPDNFVDFVLPLIEGASQKLYFQNQSLKPNFSNPRYMQLFRALRDKSHEQNIDVRILVRGDFEAATILSTLQAHNFNMSRVRLQNGNHNKGILVDGKTVLGSHNWTGDGTTLNRDASLIFDDADVASYYERLFLYDWDNLSFSDAPELLEMAQIAPPGAPTPPGMLRVAWDDVFSDD